MKRRSFYFLIMALLVFAEYAVTQPREQYVKVIVSPDHPDWLYKTGEKVKFTIRVLKDGNTVEGINVRYDIKPEMMETVRSGDEILKKDEIVVDGGTMNSPGFLRCWASVVYEDREYRGYATAGFEPEKIKPTTTEPVDFVDFWEQAKKELAEIPLDAVATLIPERCTEKVNVYHVSIRNYPRQSNLYGILCKPKAEGRYPALLHVPGAGIRPYYGDVENAEKGIITFMIGIHGIPVTMENYVYSDLSEGALYRYMVANLDDRDNYYYKRVYLGCVRAVDYVFSLPEFDGETLAVTGGSQGGALSIVTAGLDNRVKWLAPFYPALCDVTGYIENRAGGWPHMFRNADASDPVTRKKIEVSKYYDVVNFARHVKAEGFYSWGFNDNVCPPTSMYSAYNVINAPRQLFLAPDTGHWTYPEQQERKNNWLLEKLLGE